MGLIVNKVNLSNFIGYIGEVIVLLFLRLKLYNIIKHRYRCHLGEIDIIACKKNKLLFVEVKTSLFSGEIPISNFQRNAIISSAKYFISLNSKFQNFILSFDFCFLSLRRLPVYIENAWVE
ncbi:YraN family protein [Candidatus Mesenet endosymbiont of Phosphuga atrata]|uniref:YraN family protein n=1 Tax=Candidatus Mesenet endosymbiont of Phosphuga atrata TaxID=3066221 RepID=UPI0030D38984